MSHGFKAGDYVVYPSHGVGQLSNIEKQIVEDFEFDVFVISFEKNRMIVRVPMAKAQAHGLRALSSLDDIVQAFHALKKHYKTRKIIWSRRAQDYESKINSGCLKSLAQVIRELYRDPTCTAQSYSEKLIYQNALQRLCTELALVEKIDENEAVNRVESFLKAA